MSHDKIIYSYRKEVNPIIKVKKSLNIKNLGNIEPRVN